MSATSREQSVPVGLHNWKEWSLGKPYMAAMEGRSGWSRRYTFGFSNSK
jgi:hypothetical protein